MLTRGARAAAAHRSLDKRALPFNEGSAPAAQSINLKEDGRDAVLDRLLAKLQPDLSATSRAIAAKWQQHRDALRVPGKSGTRSLC